MLHKKVCMLGGFAVGKTSLVARFVHSIFSDRYRTTIGVKIDKKLVRAGEEELSLILWDIHGDDEFQRVRPTYLRGAHGYLLVADGTRAVTLEQARELQRLAESTVGDVPFRLLLNKADLAHEWEVNTPVLTELEQSGWQIIRTSAKSGAGVEEAFASLASALVG